MLYEDLFSYKQYRIFSYIFTNSIFLIFFYKFANLSVLTCSKAVSTGISCQITTVAVICVILTSSLFTR